MPKSEEEIDRDIESLIGSMAISGLTLTDATIADCRAILRGELDCDVAVAKVVEQYRKN